MDIGVANCINPQTCSACGETQGEALGHDFVEATCTTAQHCKVCNAMWKAALGHDYTEATYETPATCRFCGQTKGSALQLSSTCDKILAKGKAEDGSVYELVANEKESYAGVQVKVGIIKDNSWVLELGSDNPFVDNDGTIFGNATSIYEQSTSKLNCIYLGNDCFLCISQGQSLVYKANTKQSFVKKYNQSAYHPCLSPLCLEQRTAKEEHANISITEDSSMLIIDVKSYHEVAYVELLDTNTMQTTQLTIAPGNFNSVYPFSEGMFAVERGHMLVFFDKNGKEVISPNVKLHFGYLQNVYFKNGKCAAYIKNENGSVYLISLDCYGNVLSSKEVDTTNLWNDR